MQTCENESTLKLGDEPAAGSEGNLSEESLRACGLVKVSAYVRAPASANAKRVQRARDKAAQNGMHQLNVVAPAGAHAAIKALAKELQEGRDIRAALEAVLATEAMTVHAQAAPKAGAISLEPPVSRLVGLSGWRRFWAWVLGVVKEAKGSTTTL